MDPMFLKDVEAHEGGGHYGGMIRRAREAAMPFPRIWHLLAFKPEATRALSEFTQAVMRGPSPLPSGMRELIAAFTSRRNQCLF
jgi:alkylhydroperoxidase family enzyme